MGKKSNKSSRNVLALPKENFWPHLQKSELEISILSELQKSLKLARTFHPQFKWVEIRKLKKEERVKKIENFFKNLSDEELEQHKKAKRLKKSLAMGVNEVSRSIEKKQLACCLVDGQAKPKMIITHLLQLARCNNIPILILNDLKKSSSESLGFSTLAIGFMKEIVDDDHHVFHELCLSLLNNYKELAESEGDNIKGTENVKCDGSLELKPTKCSKTDEMNNDAEKLMCTNGEYTSLYIYRTSSNYRVFHPPDKESDSDEGEEMITETSVDIQSSDDSTDHCPIPTKKIKHFIEPNILRMQSNPNKFRKKKKNKT